MVTCITPLTSTPSMMAELDRTLDNMPWSLACRALPLSVLAPEFGRSRIRQDADEVTYLLEFSFHFHDDVYASCNGTLVSPCLPDPGDDAPR